MTPMMSRPLPKSLRARQKPQAKKPRKRSKVTAGLIAAAGLATAVVTMIVWTALGTEGVRRPPRVFDDKEQEIAAKLEHGDSWFSNPDLAKLERAKKLMDEADAEGATAGRIRQRTSLMAINMRTLIIKPRADETEDGKKKVEAELETGGAGPRADTPVPVSSDKNGKLIPGKTGEDLRRLRERPAEPPEEDVE